MRLNFKEKDVVRETIKVTKGLGYTFISEYQTNAGNRIDLYLPGYTVHGVGIHPLIIECKRAIVSIVDVHLLSEQINKYRTNIQDETNVYNTKQISTGRNTPQAWVVAGFINPDIVGSICEFAQPFQLTEFYHQYFSSGNISSVPTEHNMEKYTRRHNNIVNQFRDMFTYVPYM